MKHVSLRNTIILAAALLLSACAAPEKSVRPIAPIKPTEAAQTPLPVQSTATQSACDHPYLPLRLGAQWTYTVTEAPAPPGYTEPITGQWTVHRAAGDTRHATMSLSPYQENQFECSPDTGIAALGYDYTSPGFAKMFHLVLPPVDRLQPEYAWSGSNHQGMDLGGGMIALREDLTQTYTVIGYEPVVLTGQTYEGLRILRIADTHVTGCGYIPNCTNANGTLRQDTDYRTTAAITLTLARGVGIVAIVEDEEYFGAGEHHQVRRTYTLADYHLPAASALVPPQTSTPIVIGPTLTPPATRPPATIGPTRSAARAPQIVALSVSPERANPGDMVTLNWRAQGDRAILCPDSRYTLFTPADCVDVPLSGALTFVIPADVKGNKSIEFVLTVTGAASSTVTQGISVAMYCKQTWFFSAELQAGVCPQDIIHTQAAIQYFERGMMIWLKEPGRYFILENQNVAPGDIRRPLNTIADPLDVTRNTEDSVQPPTGFFAPASGFGLIWRGDAQQSSGFRDQLGWALQPEFGYEATYQCDDATPSGGRVWQTCYLTLPDGQIIALLSTGAWYWREEQLHQAVPKALTFTATRTEARPGDTIAFAWTSIGGATATLTEPVCCNALGGSVTRDVPLNGSLALDLTNVIERDTLIYILSVRNDAASDSKTIRIHLPCPDRYFFASTHDDLECPATAPIMSPAVEQSFEHGRMIWLESQRKIYVLWGNGQPAAPGAPPDGFLVFDDSWQPGEPENDPALVPPSGRYQPVRGFGKVWRDWPVVRNGLGWALAPEQTFDSVYQRGWKTCLLQNEDGSFRSCSSPSSDFQYLRAADGRVIRLTQFGVLGRHGVQQWEFWTP